ncbi:GIY-YIG nuclease family protein [uncultured Cohaesibacter sp.]|uniref:GIY-YIG nuclease family protein n=1 Tax=uncultured Cohaesibacter sp. TaxID=1002546 RepID=UPI0029C7756E|nr:GIY-YIG nuclease family protein [uncultured Cohaesibacter sp.]
MSITRLRNAAMRHESILPLLKEKWHKPVFAGGREDIESCPDDGGIYLLAIHLSHTLTIARPGPATLAPGLYLYAGSARGPGGLRARLRRHQAIEKTCRWHIDQLTTQAAERFAFGWLSGTECDLIRALDTSATARHPIGGFGSSDCKHCTSHMLYLP